MDRIPQAIAAALLAGVLARFGLDAVGAVKTAPLLVCVMALAFLLGRRAWPRYAVPGVLLAGIVVAARRGAWTPRPSSGTWRSRCGRCRCSASSALVGVALPLFVVTMASQNLPGVAAQRAAGYDTPVSPSITATGAASVLLAPFGGYAFNLAAITAAICMGREAHEDPARRYVAAWPPACSTSRWAWSAARWSACSMPSRASWCWRWPGWRCWAPSPAGWPRR